VTSGVPSAVTSGVPSGSLFSSEPFPLPLPSQSIFGRLLEPHGSRVHLVELTHSIIVTMCTHQKSAFRAGSNVLICKSLWDNLRSYIGKQRCICHWSIQLAVFHENCNLMEHLYASFLLHNWNLLIHMLKYTKFFAISQSLRIYTLYCQQFGICTHTDTLLRISLYYCICVNITV